MHQQYDIIRNVIANIADFKQK